MYVKWEWILDIHQAVWNVTFANKLAICPLVTSVVCLQPIALPPIGQKQMFLLFTYFFQVTNASVKIHRKDAQYLKLGTIDRTLSCNAAVWPYLQSDR